MTSLPFVWAMWVGRADTLRPDHVTALQAARASGVQAIDEIVARHCPDDEEQLEIGRQYLRERVSFDLDERALAGLKKFYEYAYDLRLVQKRADVRFFESPPA